LAHCHANLGELGEALVWCERALTSAKTDPALHFLHASILQELLRDEDALLALRNVLFLDPDHVLAHYTMANLHRRCGRLPMAEKNLANVRRLLSQRQENEVLPQSGGLTAGRRSSILASTHPVLNPQSAIHNEGMYE
jgi:chemotaxis protein methyltransferase CheR